MTGLSCPHSDPRPARVRTDRSSQHSHRYPSPVTPSFPRPVAGRTVVLNNLHPRASYRRVRLVRLVGMMLIVLVQDRHAAYVRNVAAECVGTGIMGKMVSGVGGARSGSECGARSRGI